MRVSLHNLLLSTAPGVFRNLGSLALRAGKYLAEVFGLPPASWSEMQPGHLQDKPRFIALPVGGQGIRNLRNLGQFETAAASPHITTFTTTIWGATKFLRHLRHLRGQAIHAPELNPDEGIWSQAKQELASSCPKDIDELMGDIIWSMTGNRKIAEEVAGLHRAVGAAILIRTKALYLDVAHSPERLSTSRWNPPFTSPE